MILTIALLFTLATVVITLLLSVRRLKNYNFGRFSLIFAVCFLIAGFLLTIFSSNEISMALIRQSWPVKPAIIVETNIVGDRAYSPQLKCKYEVQGRGYTLTTDLNTPGFGRKRSRRQTSEIILNNYPVGSEVKVLYNPKNPTEAYIRIGPYWSDYMQLSLGILLLTIGLYGILGITFKKLTTE
jgi:hypothetical protein